MTDPEQTGQTVTQGVATPQVQTSAPTTSTTEAAQENTQATPQYVTVEQLSQFGEQLASRLKQSDRDRTAKINSEIAQIKSRLEVTGVQLAPEQELKLRDKIGNEIDEPPTDNVQTQAGQASPAAGADQLIADFVGYVFTDAGTTVTKDDPEWKDLQAVIDTTYNDPMGHIKITRAAYKAAETKAQRTTANSESAAARVLGSGGAPSTNLDGPEVTGHALFQRAHKK